jgi:zinc D-Ala-D-Ala carboxypeptidase
VILLSPHFTLHELVRSDVAIRKGIDNTPDSTVLENLKVLANKLEIVRSILGRSVLISSGYRCAFLNTHVGGSPTSKHVLGLAADFTCPSFGSLRETFDALRERKTEIGYDQLIIERPPHGWLHIAFAEMGKVARGNDLLYAGGKYERVT